MQHDTAQRGTMPQEQSNTPSNPNSDDIKNNVRTALAPVILQICRHFANLEQVETTDFSGIMKCLYDVKVLNRALEAKCLQLEVDIMQAVQKFVRP